MFFKFLNYFSKSNLLVLILLASSVVNADWFALNMTRGSTDISNEVFELHMLIFWICVAIGVVVFSVMFYSMWAHTKKKNPIPAKFHENHKLEIAWTIIPFLILIAMAVPASKTLVKIYHNIHIYKPRIQKTHQKIPKKQSNKKKKNHTTPYSENNSL